MSLEIVSVFPSIELARQQDAEPDVELPDVDARLRELRKEEQELLDKKRNTPEALQAQVKRLISENTESRRRQQSDLYAEQDRRRKAERELGNAQVRIFFAAPLLCVAGLILQGVLF